MKRTFILGALVCFATHVDAQTTGESTGPSFGGIGSVSGGVTNRGTYQSGAPEGSYRNTQFGLRMSMPFGDRLSVSALANWREEGLDRGAPRTDITYLFATYRLSRAWDLRIGKVKAPSNLYSEVYDIGTLRPFLSLPQGIYGGTGNAFTSYTGIGVNGTAYVKNWQLGIASYASGGNYRYTSTRFNLVPGTSGDMDVNLPYLFGGRIFVRPPVPGLLLGVSGVAARISTCPSNDIRIPCRSDIRARQGSAQLEYVTPRLWLRSEAAMINGPGFLNSRGGYAQAAWFLTRKWQVATQYDVVREDLSEVVNPSSQGASPFPPGTPLTSLPPAALAVLPFPRAIDTHRDVALGLNYWFSPDMAVKLSVHDVSGWRFASPGGPAILQGLVTGTYPPVRSRLLQAGIQFNF